MTCFLLAKAPPDWTTAMIIAGIVCAVAIVALLVLDARQRRAVASRDDWLVAASPPLRCPQCGTKISLGATFASISPLSITCTNCRAHSKILVPGFFVLTLVMAAIAFGACLAYFWVKHAVGEIAGLGAVLAIAALAQLLGYLYYSSKATLYAEPDGDFSE